MQIKHICNFPFFGKEIGVPNLRGLFCVHFIILVVVQVIHFVHDEIHSKNTCAHEINRVTLALEKFNTIIMLPNFS